VLLLSWGNCAPPVTAQGGVWVTVGFFEVHSSLQTVEVHTPREAAAPGQTVRVTQANLIPSQGQEQHPVEIFARVRLCDTHGAVIAESAEVRIPKEKFHSFNFNRDDLHVAGEPGTGRLQMCVSIEVRSAGGVLLIRDGKALGLLPSSSEIVDNSTGMTNVSIKNEPQRWFSEGPAPNSGSGNDYLIGIVPGQMLRFSVFNPPTSISGEQREPLHGHVKVFDKGGVLIAQSAEMVIPPGEFRFVDFKREDLPLLGEAGTGRLQGRGKIVLWVRDATQDPARFALVSVELVDQGTGTTGASVTDLVIDRFNPER
jgi:hypothetical protein